MTRSLLFALALLAGVTLIVLTVLTWSGAIIGHHADGPGGLENFKHGALFMGLAIVTFVFAAASRPSTRRL